MRKEIQHDSLLARCVFACLSPTLITKLGMSLLLVALLPLTWVFGKRPFFLKRIFTDNSAMQIATINIVIRIVLSISINFVLQIYSFCHYVCWLWP